MAFPKQSDVEVPLLQVLRDSGGSVPKEVYPKVATYFPDLTPEEQDQRLESSAATRKWWNLVQWARQDLVQAGEVDGSTRGVWKLTEAGRARLSSFEAQPDAQVRIQGKIEATIPDAEARRSALEFLAYAIENADDERPDGWSLKDNGEVSAFIQDVS